MNNCVTLVSLRPFVDFLFWTTLFLIWIWAWPLRVTFTHTRAIWALSSRTRTDAEKWYHQWWSYGLGPVVPTVFRLFAGLSQKSKADLPAILTSWMEHRLPADVLEDLDTSRFSYRSFGASKIETSVQGTFILLFVLPPLLSLVTMGMLGTTIRNILQGVTTLERLDLQSRGNEKRFMEPDTAHISSAQRDPRSKPFDLGWKANWITVMGRSPLQWLGEFAKQLQIICSTRLTFSPKACEANCEIKNLAYW